MIYLIADTHFNHQFLVDNGLRLGDYDRRLWRALKGMPESAWLIHLGDVSIGHDDEIHRELNRVCPAGHRVLVRGNHDSRGMGWFLERGWSHVTDGMIMHRYGLEILFTHEPCRDLPAWIDVNIHGHLHAGVHRGNVLEDGRHVLISCETTGYVTVPLKQAIRDVRGK